MATAAAPVPHARAGSARFGRWVLGGSAALLALLLLVATISGQATGGCAAGGTSTGDVTAVGDYPKALRFGPYTMYPGQLRFADVVAKRTKWDLWVIRAQILNEENGAAALERVATNNHNWLNVGYFDQLGGGGAYQTSRVWKDPVAAGNATADWIQGKRTLGQIGAPSIREAYERGATASPREAIALLQNSGWASSRYPALPGIYDAIAGEHGAPAEMVQAGIGAGDAADGPSCDADAGGPVRGGVAAAGAIAHRYLGATSPSQMPGFTGAFPVGQWCSWFVTNVLRKAGVDMPVQNYSGAPYTWAAQHPDAWDLFKPLGRPAKAATPPVGSLVMYRLGGRGSPTNSSHINMVEKTYSDGRFDVIGGNQGSGCSNGSCVSEHKACRLVGWKASREPHLDCGDDRPIWGIVTPRDSGSAT